jgi:hypothetical protein
MSRDDETGIEELRALVSMAGWTRESAFDGFDAIQTVRLLQACRKLDLEVLPDQLTRDERREAARTGVVSEDAVRRLYRAEFGPNWEGR